ncbi:glycoside hydrolase family 38 N-terminal domain-containing protein [Agromyces agglutinans]|uniref:glycoside hydrolase family 38 N-terminal domain-containing protein n=1 Tax=Agromyces agglutinans TaxID=2662258 RepID=UPI00156296E2|nr:hypothetical protein [Agromyces agglutinans]
MADQTPTCHVVTHVHWDREWYRPFESYRTRLVELVEQVSRQLDAGAIDSFHLDGQTITLRDVRDLRPDLVDQVRRHVQAGRLTIGPWHVLADNQLVSGENLIRNLLAARRHGASVGALTGIGYSPDAFGHPADLPRILAGFGIDTALVWRGAPAEHAEFRWRSPDGSEVYSVNQCYYGVDVLWNDEGRGERLRGFLDSEAERRPGGPWLLMNGADHVAPRDTTRLLADSDADAGGRAAVVQSSLERFFDDLRAAAPSPAVVEGELRHLGGPGTFLLPGTLSTRVYLKQENAAAEALLERELEPLLAAEVLTPRPIAPALTAERTDVTPIDADVTGHLRHAWELVLENAPHDSICGCSVDEVHRENSVRSERVMQLGDQLVRRALLRRGLDPRVHATPATESTRIAVHPPIADAARRDRARVEADVVIAPDRVVAGLTAPDGSDVAVEVEDLGTGMSFEADLDLLPDSVPARRQRLRFLAEGVAPGETAVFTVVLAAREPAAPTRTHVPVGEAIALPDGRHLVVTSDAGFDIIDEAAGTTYEGLARLVDGGDRGDTYTYDPPASDRIVPATAADVTVERTPVRTVVRWTATLDVPVALDDSRDGRTDEVATTPVEIEVSQWHGRDGLDWSASFTNASLDHRLRAHFPVSGTPGFWRSGQHFSSLDRPFGPELGELPTERNREAEIGTHPAHGYVVAGAGDDAVALVLDHVSEVQGLEATPERPAELALTLLRSTGWLSRFDLRTRTTGAGPMLPTPEAQVLRPVRAHVALRLGASAADTYALADAADARRAQPVATQLREGTDAPAAALPAAVTVEGAIVSAFKPADDGAGAVLRLVNPTPDARTAWIAVDAGIGVTAVRFDETPVATGGALVPIEADGGRGRVAVELLPQASTSFRLETIDG